ncbi:MAG TPA: zf-HC2 domain-containing protein [Planctomycetota bacterium]|nr:zf-HC2 domain-containing protein [Planctomycetota bacterium]
MKCHESKRHLDLFMDGELSVPENLKVLEHLNLCRPCAGIYEGEKALRAALCAGAGRETAPAGLAERLAGGPALEAAPLPTIGRRRRRWSSVAAAAVFLLVMLTLLFTTPAEMPKALANEISEKHIQSHEGFCGAHRDDCLCLCARCNTETVNPVGKFFQRRVPYEVCSHELKDLGYEAIGAEFWSRKELVCLTVYHNAAGNSITHGLVTTKIAMEPGPLFVCDGAERPVVMMPSGKHGMTCVFVFDSESEATRFRMARDLK